MISHASKTLLHIINSSLKYFLLMEIRRNKLALSERGTTKQILNVRQSRRHMNSMSQLICASWTTVNASTVSNGINSGQYLIKWGFPNILSIWFEDSTKTAKREIELTKLFQMYLIWKQKYAKVLLFPLCFLIYAANSYERRPREYTSSMQRIPSS